MMFAMVKRLFLICVAALIAVVTYITPLTFAPEGGDVEVYLQGKRDGGEYTGYMTVISTDISGAKKLYKDSGYMGITIRYAVDNMSEDALCRKMQARRIYEQEIDGIRCVYLYSPLINESVRIDGKVINMQIAITDSAVTVGFPLIMGSY